MNVPTKAEMAKEERRLTVFRKPRTPMSALWRECPECLTINGLKHAEGCSQPHMNTHRCTWTQFTPPVKNPGKSIQCTHGQWLILIQEHRHNDRVTVIETNDKGQQALFEF